MIGSSLQFKVGRREHRSGSIFDEFATWRIMFAKQRAYEVEYYFLIPISAYPHRERANEKFLDGALHNDAVTVEVEFAREDGPKFIEFSLRGFKESWEQCPVPPVPSSAPPPTARRRTGGQPCSACTEPAPVSEASR